MSKNDKRRWRVDYYVVNAYDEAHTFTRYYRTIDGARIAAWLRINVFTTGGVATMTDRRKVR